MSKHRWWLWLLLAIVSSIAWWAAYRRARAPYQVSREQKTTKVVKPAKVESATGIVGCCGVGSLDERELIKVNYGEIILYTGPIAQKLSLKDLVDVAKLRAIKLDRGPTSVYLGSIATGVVFSQDKQKLEDAYFEHYYGTIRQEGVISDIGFVRWPRVFYSPAKEKGSEGMLNICVGMYPPAKKPKVLRAGVISPKGGEIRYQ